MLKKNSAELKFSGNGYIAKIREGDYTSLCAAENRDNLHRAAFISIYDKDKNYICTYAKSWINNDSYSPNIFNIFIKSFLEDIEFRKTVDLIDGDNWAGTVPFTANSGVNIKCREMIDIINKNNNPKFNDFMRLKTFGIDKFSKTSYEELIKELNEEDIDLIESTFKNRKAALSTFRWINRGLRIDYAIRKTLVDLEIRENMEKKKTAV